MLAICLKMHTMCHYSVVGAFFSEIANIGSIQARENINLIRRTSANILGQNNEEMKHNEEDNIKFPFLAAIWL